MNISDDQLQKLMFLSQALHTEIKKTRGYPYKPEENEYILIHKSALSEEVAQDLEKNTGYRWDGKRFAKPLED